MQAALAYFKKPATSREHGREKIREWEAFIYHVTADARILHAVFHCISADEKNNVRIGQALNICPHSAFVARHDFNDGEADDATTFVFYRVNQFGRLRARPGDKNAGTLQGAVSH